MPKISVVLPTYNGTRYVRESIDSIREQSFQDWELIIVDDCSTDDTSQIVDEYSSKDRRISVIHNHTNQKLPRALNIGFSHAKGDYFTWTSDDNIYHFNAFEVMLRALEKDDNIKMVKADMSVIDDVGNELFIYKTDVGKIICQNNVCACFMYKREVYEVVGEYDCDLFCVEDYDYWIRIEKEFNEIVYIPQNLYKYRIHDQTLTKTRSAFASGQLIKLREKHCTYILDRAKLDKRDLFYLYYDSLEREKLSGMESPLRQILFMCNTEFQNERHTKKLAEKYIIFGAGKYGDKAYSLVKDKAFFYVDNDKSKVGKRKNGLEVIDFERLKTMMEEYSILISVDKQKIYDIVRQLLSVKIQKYCTYQYLEREFN